jgi:hypothetical protein
VLPAWDLTGAHDLELPTGFASLHGKFLFGSLDVNRTTLEGRSGSFDMRYDASARLAVSGFLDDFTFLSLEGTWAVVDGGVHTVTLLEDARRPRFRFDGTVQPGGREIRGTYDRSEGFLGLTGTTADREFVLTLDPALPTPPDRFRLRTTLTMDRRGVVKGGRGPDGKEVKVRLDGYGGRVFEGGIARGRVRTSRTDGTTTAAVKVRGRGWSVRLDGPVDESGFHALADVKAGGFVLTDVPATLAVRPGPEPPPPPPPPDPPNLIPKANARIVGGRVLLSRENAPSKFFGTGADVNLEFPTSVVGAASFVADPTTSSGVAPRRFYVTLGTRTFGTAAAPGSVTMSIPRDLQGNLVFSTIPGKTIEVVCSGSVADASGRTKSVDVIVRATVVQ